MAQLSNRASAVSEGAALEDGSACQRSPAPEPSVAADAEDWNKDPSWSKAGSNPANPADHLRSLSREEITARHIKMLDELTEQTHPLAAEYLMVAMAIAPDSPGRDRKVNTGCKLVNAVNLLIMNSQRLSKGAGN